MLIQRLPEYLNAQGYERRHDKIAYVERGYLRSWRSWKDIASTVSSCDARSDIDVPSSTYMLMFSFLMCQQHRRHRPHRRASARLVVGMVAEKVQHEGRSSDGSQCYGRRWGDREGVVMEEELWWRRGPMIEDRARGQARWRIAWWTK